MATNRAGAAPALNAYVLHSYDWSETSLIVELFTRERGRVAVAARGAKRPTSQLRPVLLPFQPIFVQLGKTAADEAAEIHTLRSAEWVGGAAVLGAGALFSGFYVNELLLKLLARQDPHAVLFDAYADTLSALNDEGPALRAFELMLLRELGVLPELALETPNLQPLRPGHRYTLDAEAGLVACAQGAPEGLDGAVWVALEAALGHGHPAALRALCAPLSGALRVSLRGLLHYHLGHATLRTRQVMRGLQQLAENPRP